VGVGRNPGTLTTKFHQHFSQKNCGNSFNLYNCNSEVHSDPPFIFTMPTRGSNKVTNKPEQQCSGDEGLELDNNHE